MQLVTLRYVVLQQTAIMSLSTITGQYHAPCDMTLSLHVPFPNTSSRQTVSQCAGPLRHSVTALSVAGAAVRLREDTEQLNRHPPDSNFTTGRKHMAVAGITGSCVYTMRAY